MIDKKHLKKIFFFINRNPLSKRIYKREVSKRELIDPTKIDSLSKPINLFSPYTNEISNPNDWYGHAKIFKKYLGIPQTYQFKFTIEHGLHLIDEILDIEFEANLPYCLTQSKYRTEINKKFRKKAFYIGPFIHYASFSYSSEKIFSEKKRLGKNILIFPAHSINYLIARYNDRSFLQQIKKISRNFDKVRICLYWADIQLGLHKYYLDSGFECVTAGHILDPMFLPRLKSLIEISDLTISNDVGTSVGYCTFMDKPHIILHQFPKLETDQKWKKINQKSWSSKSYRDTLNAFSKINYSISPEQRKIVNYYFGGKKDIKNKEEFRKIVNKTESAYQHNS